MFVVLKDDGKLKIWVRKTTRNMEINPHLPDMTVNCSNAKKVALAMLKPYPSKIVMVERGGKASLLVAVKVREYTLEALKALSKAERISSRKAAKLLEKPTPRTILKTLTQQ